MRAHACTRRFMAMSTGQPISTIELPRYACNAPFPRVRGSRSLTRSTDGNPERSAQNTAAPGHAAAGVMCRERSAWLVRLGAVLVGSVAVLGMFAGVAWSASGWTGNGVAIGDVNGDGHPDLVLAGRSGVAVLLGRGDGTFQPPVNCPVSGDPSSVAIGDLNGDGHPDLATADFGSGGLLCCSVEGMADSSPPAAITPTATPFRLRSAILGDGRAARGVLASEQDSAENPSSSAVPRRVGQAWLDHARQVAHELAELRVIEPQAGEPVAGAITNRVKVLTLQVAVNITQQPRDERDERLAVIVSAHPLDLVDADARGGDPEHVGAFDSAADPSFANDRQDARVDESRHVTVEARWRDVGELTAQIRGRQCAVAQERLHDPQAHRVQKQVGAGQGTSWHIDITSGNVTDSDTEGLER
jgi:FG-GAP-like repeat